MSTEIYNGNYGINVARVAQFCEICKRRGNCVGFYGGAHSNMILCVDHFTALVQAIINKREFKP